LNSLGNEPGLWQTFIPIAWHVDYWDGLGWRDRFARPAHSARQRAYAGSGHLSQVYTPGVLRGGREWRSWPGRPGEGSAVDVGTLELHLGTQALVRFKPVHTGQFIARVASLGFELESVVVSGENTGRRLQHDFVVLDSRSAAMARGEDGVWQATLERPQATDGEAATAWVAWVEEAGSPLPVQATGGRPP
jgi:hypothetical protein